MKTSTLLPTVSTLVLALASAAVIVTAAFEPAVAQPLSKPIMNTYLLSSTPERFVSLHGDQVRRLHGAVRLRVALGTVWLTVTRQTEDHMLLPGDHFTLDHGSDALVQALSGRACLVVSEAAPSWTERAMATLQTVAQRFAGVPA